MFLNCSLNCSILTLHEHDQIISDIEEIWLLKGQDTKFKFCNAAAYTYDYIIFRKNTDF